MCGLEYSEAALKCCRSRKLSAQKFDLETDVFNGDRAFDLAVSMEVAEHLPQTCADRYIDLLARLSPVIVFTAAPPGQRGTLILTNNHPHTGSENFISVVSVMLKIYPDAGAKTGRLPGMSEIGRPKSNDFPKAMIQMILHGCVAYSSR